VIIGVDIDNTIAATLPEILKRLGWKTVAGYNLFRTRAEEERFFLENAEIFARVQPYSFAAEALQELAARGHEIAYISARPRHALGATELWLEVHGFPAGRVILTGDKPRVLKEMDAAVMVEDAPGEIAAIGGLGVPVIIKDQVYNRFLPGPRFSRWGQFLKAFEVVERGSALCSSWESTLVTGTPRP